MHMPTGTSAVGMCNFLGTGGAQSESNTGNWKMCLKRGSLSGGGERSTHFRITPVLSSTDWIEVHLKGPRHILASFCRDGCPRILVMHVDTYGYLGYVYHADAHG